MFQTKVDLLRSSYTIGYDDAIMTMGSCFAENMGSRMSNVWFDVFVNPFGVLYNPNSIRNSICRLMSAIPFEESELFESRGMWNSFAHSTLFSGVSPTATLASMNDVFMRAVSHLTCCKLLIITFGTAWVFEDVNTGEVVANCHKLPSKCFRRRMLSVDEIVASYSLLLTDLKANFPDIRVLFSVSPVRHWKDGAHGNNLSKSTLLLAVNEIVPRFDFVDYFPAYEIQMDELRDYRFYASDMLHPSDVAVDYIWQRFASVYFSESTLEAKRELERLRMDLNHRPLFPDTGEFAKFEQALLHKKSALKTKYPFLSGRLS